MCQILQLIHGENIAARRICSEGNEISGCPVMHVRVGCVCACVCVCVFIMAIPSLGNISVFS